MFVLKDSVWKTFSFVSLWNTNRVVIAEHQQNGWNSHDILIKYEMNHKDIFLKIILRFTNILIISIEILRKYIRVYIPH